jgi:hypothetical protein
LARGTAQDWTIHGLNALTLQVRGRAENNPMRLYLTVKDSAGRSATVANPNTNVVTTAAWQEWSVPFTALTPVDLTQVSTLIIETRSDQSVSRIDDLRPEDIRGASGEVEIAGSIAFGGCAAGRVG